MSTTTSFKGFKNIGESLLNEQLEHNIVEFFDWSMLGVGGFFNVRIPTSGAFGGDEHRLRPVTTPNFNDGQVWEGFRQNWVWESGIEHKIQPIAISGVRVDNTFHPTSGIGSFSHYIDYINGRVVFDSGIAITSVVEAEYSFKWINFTTSNVSWFRELMFNSFRVDSSDFLQAASGMWSVLGQNRVQLPAVMIESVPNRTSKGLQLGGGQIVNQDILFHIFSEDSWTRNNLIDVINFQNKKTILLFDRNLLQSKDAYPLDFRGALRPNATTYPRWVEPTGIGGFRWHKSFVLDVKTDLVESPQPLFRGVVRMNLEIPMPEL